MRVLAAWLGVVVALSPASAQQADRRPEAASTPSVSDDEAARPLDDAVRRSVARVIHRGVELYNEHRDPVGCYRLYQGALIGLGPLLDHRPQLQFAIETGLARADELATIDVARAAVELRGVLDRTYEATGGGEDGDRTLWERLGGEEAVRAIVHDFVALAANDAEVDFSRGGRFPVGEEGAARLEDRLVGLISDLTGGPIEYTGRGLKALHEGMEITDAQFDALAADLAAVLRSHEVPRAEAEELTELIGATRGIIVEVEPLWERLGGEEAIRAIVNDFVGRAARNPEVNFSRDGRHPLDPAGVERLKDRLVRFLSEATGGPLDYEGRPMGPAHRGMGITEGEFDAMTDDLVASLRAAEVPQELIDELLAVIAATEDEVVESR